MNLDRQRIDWIMRAVDLLLRNQNMMEMQMSALSDALLAKIDAVAAKVAESVGKDQALAELAQAKTQIEMQLAAVVVERDEANAVMQAALDKLNALDATIVG